MDFTKAKRILYNGIPIYILIIVSAVTLSFFINLAPEEEPEEEEVNEHALDPDLFAYWSFDESEGQTITEETGRFDETRVSYLFNDAGYMEPQDPSWRENGVRNNALLFDGFTTHFNYRSYDLPEDSFTISVWVAPRAFPVGYEGKMSSFISNYTERLDDDDNRRMTAGLDFGMFRHGGWGYRMVLTDDNGHEEYIELWENDHRLEKYEWNHLLVSYNASEGRVSMYRNGELANETTTERRNLSLKESQEDLYIGKNANSYYYAGNDGNSFMGLKDELRIYSIPHTSQEAENVYKNYRYENDSQHPEVVMDDIMWHDTGFETDRYRPQFHAVPVQSWMNEPYAPFYYEGRYHLFYQFNPFGPYFGQHHWGHWVSDDMVHWEHEKPALAPIDTDNDFAADGIWSGGATLDAEGRPVLFYTAGPSQTISKARPRDLSDPNLAEWDMYPDTVIHSDTLPDGWNPADFRDPYIWHDEERGEWYMLITAGYHDEGMGRQRGASALYSSTNLRDWTFRGPMLDPDTYHHESRFGSSWELTVMLPLKNEDGEHIRDIYLFLPHGGGAEVEVFYYKGEFNPDTYRFEPDHEVARRMDYGDNIFTGPSGFVDPETGRSILYTIAQGDRDAGENFSHGWAHNTGMPIELWIDDEGTLQYGPIEEIENARGEMLFELDEEQRMGLDEIDALNEELDHIQSDLLEVELSFSNESADEVYFKLRQSEDRRNETIVGYDFVDSEAFTNILNSSNLPRGDLSTPISSGPVSVDEDGRITMRIFLDRSLLETYVNNEMSITKRIYPDLADALGVEIGADGYFTLHSLTIYEMTNVYGETKPPYYE